MDPVAAYKRMWELYREAIASGDPDDFQEALEASNDIQDWIMKGGFKPLEIPHFESETCYVAIQCHRAIRAERVGGFPPISG